MGSWATASVLSNQFIPLSMIFTNSTMNSNLEASFHRIYRSANKEKFSLSYSRDNFEVGSRFAIKSSREVSYFQTQRKHTWEEPDIGSDSDSEYDDDDDDEDQTHGFENDGEEEETKTSATTDVNITSQEDKYEEHIWNGTYLVFCFFFFIGAIT